MWQQIHYIPTQSELIKRPAWVQLVVFYIEN